MSKRGPRPVVTYDGNSYTCKCWKVEIPNLDDMTRVEALSWLLRNTTPRGYTRPGVNLHGYASAARVIAN